MHGPRAKTSTGGEGQGGSGAGSGDEQFEALLERALRIDVPQHRPVKARKRPARPWGRLAIAAAVVLAIGVTVNTLQQAAFFGSDDLSRDVMVHVWHEPAALVTTDQPVVADEMERVLRAAGAAMSPLEDPVSYVKLCPFRGEMVAHLAVQGRDGAVIVLLLPDEQIDAPVQIEENGFSGTIVPLGSIGGSFAVVGESPSDIEDIKNQVADAVRWRL